mmetsp:Transcript_13622/g.27064  ORF Transcript_13622/g.27064 Transcript_13622/m.27064 type:complete len:103 (-) Transcript_13622:390-698(-)
MPFARSPRYRTGAGLRSPTSGDILWKSTPRLLKELRRREKAVRNLSDCTKILSFRVAICVLFFGENRHQRRLGEGTGGEVYLLSNKDRDQSPKRMWNKTELH